MGLHADTKKILLNLNLLSMEKKNGIIDLENCLPAMRKKEITTLDWFSSHIV